MEIISLISIQFLVFISYVYFIFKKYGVLFSISSSWYELPKDKWWLFTMFTWGIGVPALLLAITLNQPLWGVVGMLMCITGISGAVKQDMTINLVHNIGALGSILVGCLALILIGWWYSLVGLVLITILFRIFKLNNFVWWFEISSFLLIESGLIFKYVL